MANTTIELQRWLELLQAGDDRGRKELINHASHRLQRLTRRMLKSYPRVRRWEQTDDVLQNSLMRLYRALADVQPQSLRHFYNLAALQIRRELLDLSKHYLGPAGETARQLANAEDARDGECALLEEKAAETEEPATLEGWTEFHTQVEALPQREREVFNLVWYEGLSQNEVAEVLNTSLRTVKRRWQTARVLLYQALHGDKPD